MDPAATADDGNATPSDNLPPLAEGAQRYSLKRQEELRVEIPFAKSSTCQVILQQGSCELWGCELAIAKKYEWEGGGLQLALFTWHGCVLDVEGTSIDIAYTSDETDFHVALVNTHAQLEALRDDALQQKGVDGPRVMLVGPPESGKSSFVRTLVAYACKVGRTPLWVDLDSHENSISIPGTISVTPMVSTAIGVESWATTGIPPNTAHPMVMWQGASAKTNWWNADLLEVQLDRLGSTVQARFKMDELARASGLIVNTSGSMIQDNKSDDSSKSGFQLLLHAAQALEISVILVLGHDRLYSMLRTHYQNEPETARMAPPKVLKLPRSGGAVSRSDEFLRQTKSRSIKKYFYGDTIEAPDGTEGETKKVPQLTPFLLQINVSEVQIYKLSSMALSSSLLPVAQQQTTDAIQVEQLQEDSMESIQHAVLAVCHPSAVQAFSESGRGRDLWVPGVAGFCVVERFVKETDTLHLLSPCAGALPSKTLLLGDVTWME